MTARALVSCSCATVRKVWKIQPKGEERRVPNRQGGGHEQGMCLLQRVHPHRRMHTRCRPETNGSYRNQCCVPSLKFNGCLVQRLQRLLSITLLQCMDSSLESCEASDIRKNRIFPAIPRSACAREHPRKIDPEAMLQNPPSCWNTRAWSRMRENSKPLQPQAFEGIEFQASVSVQLTEEATRAPPEAGCHGALRASPAPGAARKHLHQYDANLPRNILACEVALRRPRADCPLCAIAPRHKDV